MKSNPAERRKIVGKADKKLSVKRQCELLSVVRSVYYHWLKEKPADESKDLNRNITTISYNSLNLPHVISFGDGNTVTYVYDGSGVKLSVSYKSGCTTTKTDYVGNKVYNNGTLSMIQTEEGYVTLSGTTPSYYFYLKDHQGNNRVVINQSGGVQQVNHYYAFGGLFGEGLQTVNQPYRYNGKELDRFQGLNMYDYGARHYDATLARWFTVDPLAEKYYFFSPYVYCMNNPIRFIDPDGRKIVYANRSTAAFKKAFAQSVQHLNKHGAGGMLAKLEKSEKVYYISETSGGSSYNPSTNTISWDPTKAVLTNEIHELSPTTVLNHEVDHALQHDKNPEQQKKDGKTPDAQYGNKEDKRVIEGSEQKTAKKLGEIKEGEVTRKDHGGTLYETTGPTSTEWKNAVIVTPKEDE